MVKGFPSCTFFLASTFCVGRLAQPTSKLLGKSFGKSAKREVSSESFATQRFREAKPREWTFPRFATSVHETVVQHVKFEKNSVVIVDPTKDDLVASVQVACRVDARHLVYLALDANMTKERCTELGLDEIKDLRCAKNKLLVVVDDVDAEKYYEHVDALVGITKKLDHIRLVILTSDPHVAKVCKKQNSKILYDQHNQMLSKAYVESKLGCNDPCESINLVMQSNSPSFVEYVSAHPCGSDERKEVIEIGSANLRMMYENMRKALA
jgi:hypothetical protein